MLEGGSKLGFQVLAVLHFGKVVVQVGEDGMELVLVGLLGSIEFDDSALEDVDEVEEKTIIGLFLVPSGKTRVYRHDYFYFIHKPIKRLTVST